MDVSSPIQAAVLSENEVCERVASWFDQNGFDARWIPAGRPGLDIEAFHRETRQRWIVEAKGLTNSNQFSQDAAYKNVSQAYWMASRWACLEQYKDANIGIALPSTRHFDNHSRPVESACRLLGISIFRVNLDRSIETVPAGLCDIADKRIGRPDLTTPT